MSYLDKLAKVEALLQRAVSEGERQAAQLAKEHILGKISDIHNSRPIKYKISLDSPWKKRLFVTLCGKHGYKTYRYMRQKCTTAQVMITSPHRGPRRRFAFLRQGGYSFHLPAQLGHTPSR